MSDVIPVQHESAVAVLREMERDLDTEIQALAENLRLATARRDVLLDAIARLTRVPRTRKPRVVAEAAPETDDAPRPTVFARPANDPAGEAEAA